MAYPNHIYARDRELRPAGVAAVVFNASLLGSSWNLFAAEWLTPLRATRWIRRRRISTVHNKAPAPTRTAVVFSGHARAKLLQPTVTSPQRQSRLHTLCKNVPFPPVYLIVAKLSTLPVN